MSSHSSPCCLGAGLGPAAVWRWSPNPLVYLQPAGTLQGAPGRPGAGSLEGQSPARWCRTRGTEGKGGSRQEGVNLTTRPVAPEAGAPLVTPLDVLVHIQYTRGHVHSHTYKHSYTRAHTPPHRNSAAPVPTRAAGRASGTLEAQGTEALPPRPAARSAAASWAWPCPPELSLDLLEGAGTGRQPPMASEPCWDRPTLVSCHKSSNNTSRGGFLLV